MRILLLSALAGSRYAGSDGVAALADHLEQQIEERSAAVGWSLSDLRHLGWATLADRYRSVIEQVTTG